MSLIQRFINPKWIGGGTFGQVLAADDTEQGGQVAIKKLTRAFATVEDAKRAYREIKLLRSLTIEGNGEDILQLKYIYRCVCIRACISSNSSHIHAFDLTICFRINFHSFL